MSSPSTQAINVELERQGEMLRQAQRIAKIGSWELDLRTGYLFWSDEVFRIFGLSPGQMEPSYDFFLNQIHPDDRELVNTAYTTSLETRTPYRITHRLKDPETGEIRWVEEQCETDFDEDGKPLTSRGTVQDTTESRAAELALAKSEATLHSILHANIEAILVTDPQRCIRIFSLGAELLFGVPSSEMTDRSLDTFLPDAEQLRLEAEIDRVLAGDPQVSGLQHPHGYRMRRATGEEFPAELTFTLNAAADERLVTIVIRDVSRQRSYEEALRLAMERAEAGSRAKSAFLANMSHECRTPLNGMLGMIAIALSTDLPEASRRHLMIAKECGETLTNLISGVLDLSQIEEGKFKLKSEPFDLAAVVRRAIDLQRPAAAPKSLVLTSDVASSVADRYLGDEAAMQQILNNLVSNAVKFTESGAVGVLVSATPVDTRTDRLTIDVVDTGIGIAEAHRELIFGRFTQVDDSSTRTYGGSGLGLAIVKSLVEAKGGTVSLKSSLDSGSTFTLDIKLERAGGMPDE